METEYLIIRCLKCGRKNRLDPNRIDQQPVCGACRYPLDTLIIQCFFCGAKNRISDERLQDRPICGRCRFPLYRTAPGTVSDATFDEEVPTFPGAVLMGCLTEENAEYNTVLNYFASKYAGGVKTIKVLLSDNPLIKKRFSLSDSPALLIFYNGDLVKTFTGRLIRDNIEQYLVSLIKS